MFPERQSNLAAPLAEYLGQHFRRAAVVRDLQRLTGGSSYETWAFTLTLGGAPPTDVPLVLRRAFHGGSLEMDLDAEFSLLVALHRAGLPVPKPECCVVANSPLQSPFIVVARAGGKDLRKVLSEGRSLGAGAGKDLAVVLARIHAFDWQGSQGTLLQAPSAGSAFQEVSRWASDIERMTPPSPLLCGALDWLRANAPANAELCLVHGDFKANNILFAENRAEAVIDWELAHVGDPHEDLAWTLLWKTPQDLVGGLLEPEAFLEAYEGASGMKIDGERLFFWRLFSLLKLAAIFLRGVDATAQRLPTRPMLVQLLRAIPCLEREIASMLLESLGRRGQRS